MITKNKEVIEITEYISRFGTKGLSKCVLGLIKNITEDHVKDNGIKIIEINNILENYKYHYEAFNTKFWE
jgi:hypothetical protein